MDVVVVPSAKRKDLWHLHDRLGRKVGTMTEEKPDCFILHPAKDRPVASAAIKTSPSLAPGVNRADDPVPGRAVGTPGPTQMLFFLFVNTLVDILCAMIDPRIKYS